MAEDNLQDNLYWLFMKASLKAKKGLMKLADELDLSVVQVYALCLLEPAKPMSMKHIASFLNCEPSNVTGIIDRLFVLNYIVRGEDPKDRRVKTAALTPKGEEVRQRIVKSILSYKSERLEKLSPQEQKQLKQLLVKILD